MVQGILHLKNHEDNAWIQLLYPSVGSGPGDADAPKSKKPKHKCQACYNHHAKWDPRHTRTEGECIRYLDEAIKYTCTGCKHDKVREHSSHNYELGECRWATASFRKSGERKGRHPIGKEGHPPLMMKPLRRKPKTSTGRTLRRVMRISSHPLLREDLNPVML